MSTEELVEKAKEGDTKAFETLYRDHRQAMRRLCLRLLNGDHGMADDIVQDAFVLAFVNIRRLRKPGMFAPWLARITTNIALRHLKTTAKAPLMIPIARLGEPGGLPDVAEAAEDVDAPDERMAPEKIREAIDRLPDGYRNVFRMSVMEGLSHKEIAGILGIEPHSSSSQLHRAKAMLRKILGNYRLLVLIVVLLSAIPVCRYFQNRGNKASEKDNIARANEQDKAEKETYGQRQTDTGQPRRETITEDLDCLRTRVEVETAACDSVQPAHSTVDVAGSAALAATDDRSVSALGDSTRTSDSVRLFRLPSAAGMDVAGKNPGGGRKWTLLAAGSLGPALAQNVYKLLAAGNGLTSDIDSPTGPQPEGIRTWEDYYSYLLRSNNADSPQDSILLMNIAKNNSGEIVEREKHDKPITLGLSVTTTLGGRWGVETGLQYNGLRSVFVAGSGRDYIKETQSIHYVGVPLRLSYRIAGHKRFSVYGSAGIALNIPVAGMRERWLVNDTVSMRMGRRGIGVPWQWSVSAGVGAQYRFAPKLSIYMEPTINYYIPTGSSNHTIWTERPFTFSLPVGIRCTW